MVYHKNEAFNVNVRKIYYHINYYYFITCVMTPVAMKYNIQYVQTW